MNPLGTWKRSQSAQRMVDNMDEEARSGSRSAPCVADKHDLCTSPACACICHDYTGEEL
jgi:hypothetical protein